MALVFAERVKETTTTTGTGTVTLAGAATGFRTFTSALSTGAIVTYCIEDGTNWEVGIGKFTTSGTTLARLTVIASSNSGSLVSFGAGSKNVFITETSAHVTTPSGIIYGQNGLTGCLAATYDRAFVVPSVTTAAPASGTLRVVAINLPAGLPVTNITFVTGTTAPGTPTHQWFVLTDSTRNVLAKTSDDLTTAWSASFPKTLVVTGGPFITTYTGLYYLGYLVTATTMPTIEGASGTLATGARNNQPYVAANSSTGVTTPASLTSPIGVLTAPIAAMPYCEIG